MINSAWFTDLIKLTRDWIHSQEKQYYNLARKLDSNEKQMLSGYFSPQLLERVRVHTVAVIEEPPWFQEKVGELEAEGHQVGFDFHELQGITFVDAIVFSEQHAPEDEKGRQSLLFHELVHVVQYEILGLDRFAQYYILGLQEGNFQYQAIPLECMAYALQYEFDGGLQFQVRGRVQSQLKGKAYSA